MNIIVNADDLGISEVVNSEIEKAIDLGVVTSSTILANAPAFKDGVRIAQQYQNISFGVHLNLVEFCPLTNTEIFRKFGVVDEYGCFIEGAIFKITSFDSELKNAIKEEWSAQIKRVIEAGIKPTHVDSHQHNHTINDLQNVLIEVLNSFGILKVRRKPFPSLCLVIYERRYGRIKVKYSHKVVATKKIKWYKRILSLLKAQYETIRWNWRMKKSFTMTEHFYGFSSFINCRHILYFNRRSTIELMCHPGLDASSLESSVLFEKEWLKKDTNLVSYKQL